MHLTYVCVGVKQALALCAKVRYFRMESRYICMCIWVCRQRRAGAGVGHACTYVYLGVQQRMRARGQGKHVCKFIKVCRS